MTYDPNAIFIGPPTVRADRIPFGVYRSCGALAENCDSIGAASLDLHAAVLAGSIADMRAAIEEISDMACRARVLAATLERQIARLNRGE